MIKNTVLLLLFFSCFYSCSKELTTKEIVTEGNWYISTYLEGVTNKTNDLEGYQFVFTKENILNISKDKILFYESWFTNTSFDGTKKFELYLLYPDLKKLNGTWNIMGISSGTLNLSLPGDSTQKVKKLVFEKL